MVLGVLERMVLEWHRRFECEHPETKLADAPRSGRPPSLSEVDCAITVAEACPLPSDFGVPITHWSIAQLRELLQQNEWLLSDSTLRRVFLTAKLQPHRQKMWLTSHDDEVRAKRDDVLAWFEEHPRWTRQFTPKDASWLNQIECMFSILHRRVLARGAFVSLADLVEKTYAYMDWHNETDQPCKWSYRPKSWSQKHVQTSEERSQVPW